MDEEDMSMWQGFGAYIGMMILICVCIGISQRRGVTTLSDEDKKKIEELRSSAILRHLSKFTMTLNEDNMTKLTATKVEKSNKRCIVADNTIIEKEEKQSMQVDLEKGTLNEDKTQYSHICVPLPGQQSYDSLVGTNDTGNTSKTTDLKTDTPETRIVPNLCVICHDEYVMSDKVCWASSSDCTHVFHEECIVRWLTCLGWMKLKEQKEPESMIDEEKCLNYDLECPMCRGQFICKENVVKNTPVAADY